MRWKSGAVRARAMLGFVLIACFLALGLGGCGKPPIDAALRGASNIVVIKEEQPVKVAASTDYDTLIQEGVVLRVSELSYMEWPQGQDGNASIGVVSLPRRSIQIILYADWLDLAGEGEIQLPMVDLANAEQIMQDGQTFHDIANAGVRYEPNMQLANSRIIYEWFPPADGAATSMIKLPLYFHGQDGKQVDITVEVEMKAYPW